MSTSLPRIKEEAEDRVQSKHSGVLELPCTLWEQLTGISPLLSKAW